MAVGAGLSSVISAAAELLSAVTRVADDICKAERPMSYHQV